MRNIESHNVILNVCIRNCSGKGYNTNSNSTKWRTKWKKQRFRDLVVFKVLSILWKRNKRHTKRKDTWLFTDSGKGTNFFVHYCECTFTRSTKSIIYICTDCAIANLNTSFPSKIYGCVVQIIKIQHCDRIWWNEKCVCRYSVTMGERLRDSRM